MPTKGKGPGGSRITDHPLYKTWTCMLRRCTDPKYRLFHLYGGKGIEVCERWEDFHVFAEDMGNKPSPQHSLDRVDGNGNYEPSNVRWADDLTQGRNTSRVKLLEVMGESRCSAEWASLFGVNVKTLRGRIAKGWSIRDALEVPVNPYPTGTTRKRTDQPS